MTKRYTGIATVIANGKKHTYFSTKIMAFSEEVAKAKLKSIAKKELNVGENVEFTSVEVEERNEWD